MEAFVDLQEPWHTPRQRGAVRLASAAEVPPDAARIDAEAWWADWFDAFAFDAALDLAFDRAGEPLRLYLHGAGAAWPRLLDEVLLRYQGRLEGRNEASAPGSVFDEILRRHRALHDCTRPLVRADWLHALDTWQWVLRLLPRADLALQIAALFHDVERLVSEAEVRVEHAAPDYQAFKDAHAAAGAELTAAVLADVPGLSSEALEAAVALVARHERVPEVADEARALLNDADALSFFCLNSPGFLDYYGPVHTARKVAYTLRRLRPCHRGWLGEMRLAPAIAEAVRAAGVEPVSGAAEVTP